MCESSAHVRLGALDVGSYRCEEDSQCDRFSCGVDRGQVPSVGRCSSSTGVRHADGCCRSDLVVADSSNRTGNDSCEGMPHLSAWSWRQTLTRSSRGCPSALLPSSTADGCGARVVMADVVPRCRLKARHGLIHQVERWLLAPVFSVRACVTIGVAPHIGELCASPGALSSLGTPARLPKQCTEVDECLGVFQWAGDDARTVAASESGFRPDDAPSTRPPTRSAWPTAWVAAG
jgi:hypothetical protein